MRLTAAISGSLHELMSLELKQAESAVTGGIKAATNEAKLLLRSQVENAGLGRKLSKSWQSKIYPRNQKSITAAGVLSCKSGKIIRAFNDGSLIQAKEGKFLAIPTKDTPKRGTNNKRIRPGNFPILRYGKLKFVRVSSRLALLIVNNKVMFLLVPQVKLPKKLDYKKVATQTASKLPQLILDLWVQ